MSTATAVAVERVWDHEPLTALVRHILDTHHVFTRKAIDTLPALATQVRLRHGEARPETREVAALVHHLAGDLAPHMQKEEQILFPFIESLEGALETGAGPAGSCFGSVRNPIRMMMREHDAAEAILKALRAVTRDYALPADASESFAGLYSGLQELEADLTEHIRLENEVLFPRALRLEEAVLRP